MYILITHDVSLKPVLDIFACGILKTYEIRITLKQWREGH